MGAGARPHPTRDGKLAIDTPQSRRVLRQRLCRGQRKDRLTDAQEGEQQQRLNVGAKSANDRPLVRRNTSRSNGGNYDLSEGERNGQQTNVAEESILRRGSPGVSSLAQNISKRQVSFATEEQRRGKKNKDT